MFKTWIKRIACILVMAVSLVAFLLGLGFARAEKAPEAPAYNISDMQLFSNYIAGIESVGGKTLEEAYYQGFGGYLAGQAALLKDIGEDLGGGLEKGVQAIGELTRAISLAVCFFSLLVLVLSAYQLLLSFLSAKREKPVKAAPVAEKAPFAQPIEEFGSGAMDADREGET